MFGPTKIPLIAWKIATPRCKPNGLDADDVCNVLKSYRLLHSYYAALHEAMQHLETGWAREAAREVRREHRDAIDRLDRENTDLRTRLAEADSRLRRAQKRANLLETQLNTVQVEETSRKFKLSVLDLIRKFHPDKASAALTPTEVTQALTILLEAL